MVFSSFHYTIISHLCTLFGYFVKLGDVTWTRDNPFKAIHLAWLSYTKINWRKQRFQTCMLEFVLLSGIKWRFLGSWPMDYYILTQQKPDECNTIQYNANTIPLFRQDTNPNPWAKCEDNRSSEQLRHEMQLRKFVPFKATGSPLIAGDLEGPEQLLAMTRLIGIQISRLLSELSCPELHGRE